MNLKALTNDRRRKEKTMTTFENLNSAAYIAHENTCLSIGREFLPEVARKVLDKQPLSRAEGSKYEAWLGEQYCAIDA
jgi:hypothetical protein